MTSLIGFSIIHISSYYSEVGSLLFLFILAFWLCICHFILGCFHVILRVEVPDVLFRMLYLDFNLLLRIICSCKEYFTSWLHFFHSSIDIYCVMSCGVMLQSVYNLLVIGFRQSEIILHDSLNTNDGYSFHRLRRIILGSCIAQLSS